MHAVLVLEKFGLVSNHPGMKNRIKELRKAKDPSWSQERLAEEAGTSQPQIKRLESGERKLTHEWMIRVAKALGCAPTDLISENAETQQRGKSLKGGPIFNRGRVAAGVWREPATANQEEPTATPIPRDPRYPHVEQYSLEVEGESVNKVAQNGWMVVCVPYWEARRDMVDGDLVHVERTNEADQREYTLKRLRMGATGLELWPESKHPDHQEPVPVVNYDGFTVEIIGLVIGVYNPNP